MNATISTSISTSFELPEHTFLQLQEYLKNNPGKDFDKTLSLAIAHFLTEQGSQNEQS